MNATRPKSTLSKRRNKKLAMERKVILLKELDDAVKAAKKPSAPKKAASVTPIKKTPVAEKAPTLKKAA